MTMTIEEAIKHIDEVVSNGAMCEECCKEHLQLKQWLLENIELKKQVTSLVNENTELKKQVTSLVNESTELKKENIGLKKKEKERVIKVLMDEYRR